MIETGNRFSVDKIVEWGYLGFVELKETTLALEHTYEQYG